MELIVEALSNLINTNMGPRGKEFTLLVGTLALFILFSNLSGLVPGFLPATDNVNTTFRLFADRLLHDPLLRRP